MDGNIYPSAGKRSIRRFLGKNEAGGPSPVEVPPASCVS